MVTLTGMAALNTGIFAADFAYKYGCQQKQFYPILAYMYRSACYRTAFTIQAILLSFVAYRLFTWLLFGRLSRAELQHLKDHRWSVFAKLAAMFVIFQTSMTVGSFVHFVAMYYLALTCMLLEKRIEQVTGQDEQDQAAHPTESNWQHGRIMLAIAVLYFVNLAGIRYQWRHIHNRSGSFSLKSTVTLHCYVMTSALLVKSIAMYILNLIECVYYHNDWEDKAMFVSVLNVLNDGLLVASHAFIVYLLVQYQILAITLIRLSIGSVKRLVQSIRDLVAAWRALNRLATAPVPSQEEVALQSICSICLDSITPRSDNRRVTNCTHIFHYRCLKRWARRRQECPTCRTSL